MTTATNKVIFLLPPSEGKNNDSPFEREELSFDFGKPLEIITNATEKDLKCKGTRFAQAQKLNSSLQSQNTQEAIKRYSWVMYNAIDFQTMASQWKNFFEKHFLILSWYYWIVKPKDKIANYKLPIESKWLYDFWGTKILSCLKKQNFDYIVNLLPISYAKLIWIGTKKISKEILENTKIININFLKVDGTKVAHWVKKIKWEWIKKICEKKIVDYRDFWWKATESEMIIDIDIQCE